MDSVKKLLDRYEEKKVNIAKYYNEVSISSLIDSWQEPPEKNLIYKRVILIEKIKKRTWRNSPIIFGTKGAGFLDAGYIWVPYVAQAIVSVQPLSAPTGILNYLDFVYGEGDKRRLLKEKIKISKYER